MGSSSSFSRSISRFPTKTIVFWTVLLLWQYQRPRAAGGILVHSLLLLVPIGPTTHTTRHRKHNPSPTVAIAFPAGRLCGPGAAAAAAAVSRRSKTATTMTLHAKKSSSSSKKGKKKLVTRSGGGGAGLKGFGTAAVVNKNVVLDTSPETRAFYHEFLSSSSSSSRSSWDASENWKRTALGFTTITTTTAAPDSNSSSSSSKNSNIQLRGVIATRDIAKGSPILDLPYECAINLGPEGEDPTVPALEFLLDYCETLNNSNSDNPKRHYYRMLPPYQGEDCRGSTDFFSDAALQALQSPLIVEETQRRRNRTAERWAATFVKQQPNGGGAPCQWIDGTSAITVDHLQWAVWLITSRVLTVQGASPPSSSSRLLIPYLDMCNHNRNSPHILTGRAVAGGRLRVLAGANVVAGTPVTICYGGGTAGNDRFVQDYGFLDPDERAYDIVAQELVGNQGRSSSSSASSRLRQPSQRILSEADRERSLQALRATTMREDEAALLAEETTDAQIRTAIQYRLGVKKALSKYIVVP